MTNTVAKKSKSTSSIPKNVVNKKLYSRIKNSVKKKVKVWPSAYASAQVVREYKKQGGKYSKGTKGTKGNSLKKDVKKVKKSTNKFGSVSRLFRMGVY
jgi:hypothetical protein